MPMISPASTVSETLSSALISAFFCLKTLVRLRNSTRVPTVLMALLISVGNPVERDSPTGYSMWTWKILAVALCFFEAVQDFLQLFLSALYLNGSALGIFIDSSLDFWGVPEFSQLLDGLVVCVFCADYESVDVRLCLRRVWIVLEDSQVRVNACAVQEGVVDDCWGTLAVSGWGLCSVNWGDLNLGSLGVDVSWGWGNQTLFLQGDQVSLDQNVDGATLVGWVIRDSDGFALNAVEGVVVLPKQCQRNDFGGHDWGQIRVVADVVLSQELQVLEVVGVHLALFQSVVRGGVVSEVLDFDIDAFSLSCLFQRSPCLLGGIGGANADWAVLLCGLGIAGSGVGGIRGAGNQASCSDNCCRSSG